MSLAKCKSCGEPIDPEAVEFCRKCRAPADAPSPRQEAPRQSLPHRSINIALKLLVGTAFVFVIPIGWPVAGYCCWSAFVVCRGRRRAENTAVWAGAAVLCALSAATAIPNFRELTRKGNEGAAKGNLGAIRSALSIYYGDMDGVYPSSLESLTLSGKYMPNIPVALAPHYHRVSSAITLGKHPDDTGGWLYNNDPKDRNFGTVLINCTHTDTKGTSWHSY